eukprot:202286_1
MDYDVDWVGDSERAPSPCNRSACRNVQHELDSVKWRLEEARKNAVTSEVRKEIEESVRSEMEKSVRAEIEESVRTELKKSLREEMQQSVRKEIMESIWNDLEEKCREDFQNEVTEWVEKKFADDTAKLNERIDELQNKNAVLEARETTLLDIINKSKPNKISKDKAQLAEELSGIASRLQEILKTAN